MEIRVLGDTATVKAFRLAGVEGRAVDQAESYESAFAQMLAHEELGVLLVTARAKLERRMPLVLEIPARGIPSLPADDMVDRVARMVGLRA